MGERDRRVIDPPPIVQLSLTGFDPTSKADVDALRNPHNVVQCSLIDSSGANVTMIQDDNDPKKDSRRLMGHIHTTPFVGIDPAKSTSSVDNANIGCFFIFSDLSCRNTGRYRLRFTLVPFTMAMLQPGSTTSLTVPPVESNVFEVFSAKDFPGMKASTDLTKELKSQGAAVSVRKGQ
ncbi:MAG: hypothetical protein Q9201_001594 [Fulgogasparrea decipioides]